MLPGHKTLTTLTPSLGEFAKCIELPANERLLLLEGPLLDLPLSHRSGTEVGKLLGMDQNSWATARCECAAFSCLMIGNSAHEICGGANAK